METQTKYVLAMHNGTFLCETGLVSDINNAILFDQPTPISNNGVFKFVEVSVEVKPVIHGRPVNCSIKHNVAVTRNGEFIKNYFADKVIYATVEDIESATLFNLHPNELAELHKQIVSQVDTDVFFVKVYVKYNRIVRLVNDHVQPASAKQCDSRTETSSIKDAITRRGGIKITVKGETGCGKDIFVQSVLKAAENSKLGAMTVYNRHGGDEKPEEVIFICVSEKDWRDE